MPEVDDNLLLFSSGNGGAFVPGRAGDLTFWGEGAFLSGYSDGDPVGVFTDHSLLGNDFAAGTNFARPTYRASGINGLPCLEFDGVLSNMYGSFPLSSVITASTYAIFMVVSVHTIHTNDNTPYNNDALFADTGGYFGMHLRNSPPRVVAYNWHGGVQSVELPIALDVPLLITQEHRGGLLSLAVNGGAFSTTSSGDTDSLTGLVELCQGSSALRPAATVAGALIYSTGIDDGDIAKNQQYFNHKYNIY